MPNILNVAVALQRCKVNMSFPRRLVVVLTVHTGKTKLSCNKHFIHFILFFSATADPSTFSPIFTPAFIANLQLALFFQTLQLAAIKKKTKLSCSITIFFFFSKFLFPIFSLFQMYRKRWAFLSHVTMCVNVCASPDDIKSGVDIFFSPVMVSSADVGRKSSSWQR